jgi:Txe/YoeB family toxin of Txe-Axe toxin-antitoxin module
MNELHNKYMGVIAEDIQEFTRLMADNPAYPSRSTFFGIILTTDPDLIAEKKIAIDNGRTLDIVTYNPETFDLKNLRGITAFKIWRDEKTDLSDAWYAALSNVCNTVKSLLGNKWTPVRVLRDETPVPQKALDGFKDKRLSNRVNKHLDILREISQDYVEGSSAIETISTEVSQYSDRVEITSRLIMTLKKDASNADADS